MESEKKSNSKIQLAQEAKARNKDLGQAQRKQFSCLLAVASAMEKIIPRPSYMPKRFWSPVLSEVKNSQPILRLRPATNKIKLQGVLQEDESLKVFKEFMEAEHNEENLEFWCEVNTFRKQNSLKRKELARKIVSTLICPVLSESV
ncbi:uncharacterized protein LOC143446194 isoform X2 [Clavelina lepadiformis]|uniref:uncharacterized protein LOC143446194 isoform X2 n=1 Tax=Clavelina lepadiformis TaxID=159417 RepID=UPI004042B3BA